MLEGFWHSRRKAAALRAAALMLGCGCSSGVEHDLAKVGVEGSNPFARSSLRSLRELRLGTSMDAERAWKRLRHRVVEDLPRGSLQNLGHPIGLAHEKSAELFIVIKSGFGYA
jgi:hypothetical protein